MLRKLEDISIEFAGFIYTIRKYASGETRCSCNKFAKRHFGACMHMAALEERKVKVVAARRYQ